MSSKFIQLLNRFPRLFASLFGLILVCFVIIVAEQILKMNAPPPKTHLSYSNLPYSMTDKFGIVRANKGFFESARDDLENGTVIYHVRYDIDQFGKRITPIKNQEGRNRFLAFFGGSFMFGEGVENHQTLPYYVAQNFSEISPYNFGFHGDGPLDVMAKVENYDFSQEMNEKEGDLVYLFIDGHIDRVVGSMRVYSWGDRRPFYRKVGDELLRDGNIVSAQPIRYHLLRWLAKSHILKALKIYRLGPRTERDAEYTAFVIEKFCETFRKKFPKARCFVVIYPGCQYSESIQTALENQAGIVVLDYSKLFEPEDPLYQILGDRHPTPLANKVLAEKFIEDFQKYQ